MGWRQPIWESNPLEIMIRNEVTLDELPQLVNDLLKLSNNEVKGWGCKVPKELRYSILESGIWGEEQVGAGMVADFAVLAKDRAN